MPLFYALPSELRLHHGDLRYTEAGLEVTNYATYNHTFLSASA